MASENTKFIEQTTVDGIVELALNTVDKPELFTGPPEGSLRRVRELYGDEPIEQALARCRHLVEDNPRDYVAAGAVQFLENALSQ